MINAPYMLSMGLALWMGLCSGVAAGDAPPNIVYILADDLGFGDLGCYRALSEGAEPGARLGEKSIPTPALDALAGEGMLFTRHYAGSTVCAPSRCVLLTGLHTGHARIRSNAPGLLRDGDRTVADVLRAAGYRTGCFGKWGVGHPPPEDDPARHGFDTFYGYINMYHAHNCYPEFLVRNGERVPLRNVLEERWKGRPDNDGRGVAAMKADYAPDMIHRAALDFIRDHRARSFFLYYALNLPHANNEGGRNGMEVPSYGDYAGRDWPAPEKGFAAVLHRIDGYVGEVTALLRELGLADRTLLMFSSDNGPHQEGGHTVEFFDSNGRLRGHKRDLYEGGVRVPLIARWPGVIARGCTSDHVSGFQDILPTLADIAGVPVPPCDGVSLRPLLEGRTAQQADHPYLYWEFHEQGGKQAVLLGPWKGVRLNKTNRPEGLVALYDMRVDVGEQHDRAAEHPAVAAHMAAIMAAAHTEPEE